MRQYTFEAYDPAATIDNQTSNLVYLAIRNAVYSGELNPEKPTERAEWRRMVKLFDKLEKIETKTMIGEGDSKREAVQLSHDGGTLTLEEAENELMWKFLDALIKKLPLTSARLVDAIFAFKEAAVEV